MSEDQGAEAPAVSSPQHDEAQFQYALDQLRGEQNLAIGSVAGVIAAVAGAGIWAAASAISLQSAA